MAVIIQLCLHRMKDISTFKKHMIILVSPPHVIRILGNLRDTQNLLKPLGVEEGNI